MLVPMYFLIAIWGHEHRVYAAVKFFLFTQLSSLLMLVAILALYFFIIRLRAPTLLNTSNSSAHRSARGRVSYSCFDFSWLSP